VLCTEDNADLIYLTTVDPSGTIIALIHLYEGIVINVFTVREPSSDILEVAVFVPELTLCLAPPIW
jgi:uncharacterized protein YqhQ